MPIFSYQKISCISTKMFADSQYANTLLVWAVAQWLEHFNSQLASSPWPQVSGFEPRDGPLSQHLLEQVNEYHLIDGWRCNFPSCNFILINSLSLVNYFAKNLPSLQQKKCSLTLAMSPTCRSNNTMPIG